jgi:hypothetical protein
VRRWAQIFQLEMQNGDVYYVGCNSPAPTVDTAGNGWQRLRWGGSLRRYRAT